jgi:hypothetical protein
MNMNLSELINEILSEWAYRVDDGMPNPKNPTHLKELGVVLSEMGLSHIEGMLVENLLTEKGKTPEKNVVEAEGNFKNPALNKSIKYKNAKGEDAEGIVGNLLRLPKEHPGRVAAERTLPADGTPERDAINKDLGGQNQPAKPEQPKVGGGEEGGAPKEDPAKAAQAMFDPNADPAMAARMNKEKEVQAQLAKDAEADKEAETDEEPKEDGKFNPIDTKDVAKEMPQADPETFNGDSDIPDGVEPEQLQKFNTDIQKVAQQVADAKAKGEPAPNINLCDVTVPGTNLYCDDNLGIPRDEMPQFKGTAQPGSRAASMDADASGEVDTEPVFKEMLKEKGIKTLQTEIPADKLKATQKDLVGAKVVGMMEALEKDPNHPKITAPIYVSRDGHVIDGHHRWAAIVAFNAANPDKQIPMKTTVLDMDIKDAIPMANKFAEDMGIAAKKADANKEAPSEPQKVTSAPKVTEKIKKKIENWTKEEKAFFERNEGAPGSEMRRSLGQALKDKAKGALKAIKKGFKHEVEEFKAAGEGVSKFFKGEPLTKHEQKAVKAVAFKVVTTAVFGAAFGGLSHGAVAFGKHVAMEFIPHVVGETILKGAGRAAIFADMEGEAEMDANILKFTELIAKGLEEMEITPEMMEQMVDSYNEKKERGEVDDEVSDVKAEHLHLVDELMLEMIYGFIDEVKPKQEDPDVTYTPIGKNGKPGKPRTIKYSSAIEYDETHPAYIAAMKLKDKGKKPKPTSTPSAKKLGPGDFRPTADIPPTTKKDSTKKTKKFVATPEDKARLKYRKEELAKIVESGLIPTQKKKLSGAGVFVPTEKQMQALLEVTKKQIDDPEYRLPLPKYDVSDEDIDIAIDKMKELLGKDFTKVKQSITKAGGVATELTTGEAGVQRFRDIIKKYLETGGRSAITGEFVPFNQMQLDHHVPYSSAEQRVADKKKKGIKTTLLAEQDELDSPENWDLMETPLNQLKNSLEGNALIERINKKLSASPDEKEKKKLEIEIKNIRRSTFLKSLVTSFGNGDFSGINEEALEQFNQDEMNVICKAWNYWHPNTKDADKFREMDPDYDKKLKEKGIDASERHPLSITRGVRQQGGARGRGQIKPVGELRKSFLAVVRQAGIKLMTKKDVSKADLALARAVKDVETATKPHLDKVNQLKQKMKQQKSKV